MLRFSVIVLVFLVLGLPSGARAKNEETSAPSAVRSGQGALPLPRFVTLRADKVRARTGPALRYPVRWVFRKAGLPVEVIQEFDTWRKIRDRDGQEGWVHLSLLSGSRGVIVKGETGGGPLPLRKKPDPDSALVARIEPGAVAHLETCEETGEWCAVKSQGFRGWIGRALVWGIYPDEKFD